MHSTPALLLEGWYTSRSQKTQPFFQPSLLEVSASLWTHDHNYIDELHLALNQDCCTVLPIHEVGAAEMDHQSCATLPMLLEQSCLLL
jgi:hypothetical protein